MSAQKTPQLAGWSANIGSGISSGAASLESLEATVAAGDVDSKPVLGAQEKLGNR